MTSSQKIRLLIAGPRSTEARALEELIALQTDIVIVGQSPEILNLPEQAWKHAPHVILLHVRGPQFALEVLEEVLLRLPDAKVVLVIPSFDAMQAVRILQHGAYGLLSFAQLFSQGIRAIRTVYGGELWGSRTILSVVAQAGIKSTMEAQSNSKLLSQLTEREREIVELLRGGSSNKQIASQLNISDKTVKTHLQNIFGKLQVRRRQMIFTSTH
jgi:two-component system NarL family response regulator